MMGVRRLWLLSSLLASPLPIALLPVSLFPVSLAAPALAASQNPLTEPLARQEIILARPLFTSTRRPPPSNAIVAGTPRLSAIIDGTGQQRAIFMLPGRERGVIVPVNGVIGAWQVIGIEHGAVRIRDGHGERLLRPDRERPGREPIDPDAADQLPFAPASQAPQRPEPDFAPPASSLDNATPGMPQ
ncbi:hypothetical protein [Asaia sp. HN010]|uniref:hypothetical protein n=1 Tax=Asaia sp. HN010 TaxID=3081233 RepID=UPI00301B62E2